MPVESRSQWELDLVVERNKKAQEQWEEAQAAAREKWNGISVEYQKRAGTLDSLLVTNDLRIMNALFGLMPMIRTRTQILQDHGKVRSEWRQAFRPYRTWKLSEPTHLPPKGLLPKELGRRWKNGQPRENLLALLEWALAVADAGFPGPMQTAEELVAWNQSRIPEPKKVDTGPSVSSYIDKDVDRDSPGQRAAFDDDASGSRFAEGQALKAAAKRKK